MVYEAIILRHLKDRLSKILGWTMCNNWSQILEPSCNIFLYLYIFTYIVLWLKICWLFSLSFQLQSFKRGHISKNKLKMIFQKHKNRKENDSIKQKSNRNYCQNNLFFHLSFFIDLYKFANRTHKRYYINKCR